MPTIRLQVIRQSGDDVILVRKCPLCGKELRKEMNAKEFDDGIEAWENGTCVQKAFLKADASTREMLMTGLCDNCFDMIA